MQLPSRLNSLLAQDNAIYSVVLKSLAVAEPWTLDNKTVFFYEYTDHSLKHLAEVLRTAEGLITDDSWKHLTPQDGALIVLSVVLHDCALHLSEDGFYALINGSYRPNRSRYVSNEPSWPALWEQFFAEAKRFDHRKLQSLFGDTIPVQSIPSNKVDLTLKHRLLIGEFLRKHHARLAHEIALTGIPGPGSPLLIAGEEHKDFMDLSGFVARSHNMPIRDAVELLEPGQRRVHHNCKVPFVMMVLRIADYLQIQSSRAPAQLLHLKSLVSPISRGEWRKHLAVREINQAHDDPEAIFVDCEPDTANTFVAMRSLLRDIQAELDKSWALLGEVYGRFSTLNSLGIMIRRVRSNLDDPEDYRKTRHPPYLPREFKFKAASAELLDLLVAPLYGDRPEIGVRELIQNAVDACLERDDLIARGLAPQRERQTADVSVTLTQSDGGAFSIVVEDVGVGMTPDIIEQYFLNVGASFRRSDVWRRTHETEGRSTVHRTGRFGIGLLAAFLLGQKIKVTTRSVNEIEDNGITFTCHQGDELIEVKPTSFHIGTRIEIEISKKVFDSLVSNTEDWDWYCLATPRVQRVMSIEGKAETLSQQYEVPQCEASLDATKWRRVAVEGYDDVLWSYEALEIRGRLDSVLICNGVYVTRYARFLTPYVSPELGVISPSRPSLVVFDPDGRFPLNLQREEVTRRPDEILKPLTEDVANYLANRLIEAFEHLPPGITPANVERSVQPSIPGIETRDLGVVILSREGVIPADADLIREAKVPSLLIDATNISASRGAFNSTVIRAWAPFYIAVDGITSTKISRTEFLRKSIGGDLDYHRRPTGYFASMNVIGRRILVRKSDVTELVKPGNIPRSLWSKLRLEVDLGGWQLWASGTVPELTLDVEAACADMESSPSFGFTVLYFDDHEKVKRNSSSVTSPFADAWMQMVRTPVLKQRS